MSEAEREQWQACGRYYVATLASAPDSMDLELDDVGPGAGRGLVLLASRDDKSGAITIQVFSSDALPLPLVERFISEARRCLPPGDSA